MQQLADGDVVTVLGKEQEDDDAQKDFCARGHTLQGEACCRSLR